MSNSEITLQIDGMHCGACIRRVTQSLQSVAGTEVEEVRLGAARVKLAETATTDDLIAQLGKAGFAAQPEK
jgi:copper chaperone CopZ